MSTVDLSLRALFAQASGKPYAITGQFDGLDLVNGGKHRATDVGNRGMDDPILSPIDGLAQGLYHYDTAVGIRYRLSAEYLLELWHLSVTLAAGLAMVPGRSDDGDWVDVDRGQVCGRTGNTGGKTAAGQPMPAHTHIVLKHNGVPIDVEPYLLGRALPLTPQEDTMRFRGSKLNVVPGAPTYRLSTNANFRAGPARDTESLTILLAGTELHPAYEVEGEAIGTNNLWLEVRGYIPAAELSAVGFVHSSVAERVSDVPAAGVPQEDYDAALAQVRALTGRIGVKDNHIAQYPKG